MAGFDAYLRTILDRATTEARRDGSTTVEAQHLLLAIAADQSVGPGRVLASAGLDRATLRGALDREFERTLATAGVAGLAAQALGLPPATPDPRKVPRPGESVRLALERGVAAAGRQDPRPAHLLLGILQAEHGTVPRALALAGVDRPGLAARVMPSQA